MTYYSRFLLLPQSARTLSGAALRLGVISFTLFASAGHSFPDEQCQYPNVFGPTLAPPANQVGEFRITLTPPDYHSASSVQHHFAFSTVWARLLRSALPAQTSDRCRAFLSLSLFPDIRVFLSEDRSLANSRTEPSPCIRALQDMLLTFQPEKDEINGASSVEAGNSLRRLSSPAGETTEAGNILTSALTEIFEPGTVMHSLASIEPGMFRSLNATALLVWLQRQQSGSSIGLRPLRFCGPEMNPDSRAESGDERRPHSRTIPPGTLTLLIRSGGPVWTSRLRHVVIVGEGPAVAYSRSNPPAVDRYCNREHAFAADRESVPRSTTTVRIRCLRSVRYDTAWTVFYCDPADCTSRRLAEAAMAEIAVDPDVIALGKDATTRRQDRGPYLVKVEAESK
jgi:hypothetical protein